MPATFDDLVALMARLRAPDGCPWDREQTYDTLAPMLLEEAYEAFEAVEETREGRPEELRNELGDLLFQIVFYAQVARERGDFSIEDVTDAVHAKMVRRHPHVFGTEQAADTAEVLRNWEAIKAEEKRAAGKAQKDEDTSLLDGVSTKAPALMEAHQLSTKAARVGFDWQSIEDIFDKLHEELDELREAIAERDEANRSRPDARPRRAGRRALCRHQHRTPSEASSPKPRSKPPIASFAAASVTSSRACARSNARSTPPPSKKWKPSGRKRKSSDK